MPAATPALSIFSHSSPISSWLFSTAPLSISFNYFLPSAPIFSTHLSSSPPSHLPLCPLLSLSPEHLSPITRPILSLLLLCIPSQHPLLCPLPLTTPFKSLLPYCLWSPSPALLGCLLPLNLVNCNLLLPSGFLVSIHPCLNTPSPLNSQNPLCPFSTHAVISAHIEPYHTSSSVSDLFLHTSHAF